MGKRSEKRNFLLRYVKKYIVIYLVVLLVTIVSTGIALVFPYAYSLIIKEIENKNLPQIFNIISMLLVVLLVLLVMDILRYSLYIIANNKLIVEVKNHFFELIVKGNLGVFQKLSQTEILNRVEGDINTCVNTLTEITLSICTYFFSITLTLVVMIRLSLDISIIIFAISGCLLILSVIIGKLVYRWQQSLMKKIDRNNLHFLESLNGCEEIISFKLQGKRLSDYKSQNRSIAIDKIKLSFAIVGTNKIIGILISFTVLLIYGVGSYLNIIQNKIELGIIVSMVSYANLFFEDIIAITNINIDTNILKVGWRRLKELEHEIICENQLRLIDEYSFKSISLEHVSFSYNQEKNAVQDLSVLIKPGDRVAVIGKNGSGKSTLIKMLQGYYSTYEGHIKLNGEYELSELDISCYLQNISSVSENPILFDGTVLDNLFINDKYNKLQQVIETLNKYNIQFTTEFLEKSVGYLGENLSKGEKQKIAIARAILKDFSVIILDEADSHLDIDNYLLLRNVMSQLEKSKTIVSITHDYRNMELYNRVIIMENGGIISNIKNMSELAKNVHYLELMNENIEKEKI